MKRFAHAPILKKKQTLTQKWKLSLHMCHSAHQASFYSTTFCSMKRLGVFLPPFNRMPVHYRVTPLRYKFVLSIPIYTPGWILRYCDSKVSRQRTKYSVPSKDSTQTAQNRKEIPNSNNRLFTQTAYNF